MLEKGWSDDELSIVKGIFLEYDLSIVEGGKEKEVFDRMQQDMPPDHRETFLATVNFVAKHSADDTIASACILNEKLLLLRFRDSDLEVLMPLGETVLSRLLKHYSSECPGCISLHTCQIREKEKHEGFFFGKWRSGNTGFFELIGTRKWYYLLITLLLVGGLVLNVGLSFITEHSVWVDIGQRLGAPMTVTGSVALIERFAYWIELRRPKLYWSLTRERNSVDMLDRR
jgi:hypothetical protein